MNNNYKWLPHSELVERLAQKGRFKQDNPAPRSKEGRSRYIAKLTKEFKQEYDKLKQSNR
tara:strand:+ start:239 stop:418 length:180 start_codon:yes stop_codon:yes gene_type:complete